MVGGRVVSSGSSRNEVGVRTVDFGQSSRFKRQRLRRALN
jgi:hypothetical protein